MTSDPGQDWQRLGELLIRRRLDLDPRYRNRQVFAAERGVEYRIVSDFERHRRSNYHAVTIAEIERAYELPPGSVGRVLAGGDLEPAPDAPRRPSGPAEGPADPGVVKVARQYGIDPDNADDRWLRLVRKEIADAIMIHGADAAGSQIFHDQPASHIEAAIWDDPHATRKSKELFIAAMRADRAPYEAGQQGNGRSGTAGLAPLLTLAGR